MKKSRLNPLSKKRRQWWKEEGEEIYRQLCERAGGVWVGSGCLGGFCELCLKPPDFRGLHPHEEGESRRSKGGSPSMESTMICGRCHSKEHGIEEK